ncbi:MAG: FAD-dependent oxidoreductase [Betaproteobacteria bacterium]|nr:FAD-dependent oxidoreductase [Betaproteobacteria bacterium]
MKFERLFQQVNIGVMSVKNRIAMPPMGTGFATKEGLVTEQTLDYYEARARGGAGLVIVECTCVDFPRGIHALHRLVIHDDSAVPGLTRLAQVIKKHGARAGIQLHHAGRIARSKVTGLQPVAPSAIRHPAASYPQGEVPHELTASEISDIVDLFTAAASRAKRAGFDGIEIHAAHAYLLAEFLSPFCNKRHDSYGGGIENRARMLIEVLKSVRKSVGDDYPLWYRINGREYGLEDGFTLDDAKAVAQMLNSTVDAIHVSAWGYGRSALANCPDKPGALLPLAEEIKKVVTVPVIAVGRLTPELGEQAIEQGKADIIAFGRELIADPELPNKALGGSLEDIRPCIACFHCHDVGGSSIACSVNAVIGSKGNGYEVKPAERIKRIAIIGGGPAGMEAARILSLRGHKVVLFEREALLGGQLNLAALPPHKERINPLISYLSTQLKKLDVEIRLNVEAHLEYIKSLKPDAVILATGGVPLVPQIPGIGLKNVVTALDILTHGVETGRRVVIIGGGSTGCETAELLFEGGKEVTVVERRPQLAFDMGFRDRLRLSLRIKDLPITFVMNAICEEITKDGVTVSTELDKKQFISTDTIVLALGMKPNNTLFSLMQGEEFETHLIGDCRGGGKICEAINDGFKLGCAL